MVLIALNMASMMLRWGVLLELGQVVVVVQVHHHAPRLAAAVLYDVFFLGLMYGTRPMPANRLHRFLAKSLNPSKSPCFHPRLGTA